MPLDRHSYALSALALLLSACVAQAPSVAAPAPVKPSPAAPPAASVVAKPAVPAASAAPLPPIPLAEGPLVIRVVYPDTNQRLTTRDSNFIFGSVGNGHASLAIDGAPVEVKPNGAFLAFLPVPADSAPRYTLVASIGSDTARAILPIRLQPARTRFALEGGPIVDTASVTPRGTLARRDDEKIRVSVRIAPDATAWLKLDAGDRQPLVPIISRDHLASADSASQIAAGALWASDVASRQLRRRTELYVARGHDTAHFAIPPIAPVAIDPAQWATLGEPDPVHDTDRVIIARPVPGGTYKWFLFPGTAVQVTGREDNFTRVRLDDALEVWVPSGEVHPLASGIAAPRRVTSDARVVPAKDWVDLEIPVSSRPAFQVEEMDHALVLTLYDVRGNTDIIRYGANDSLVRQVQWEQVAEDRARYTVRLQSQPYGYLTMWRPGTLVLRVRRPPTIDPRAPLKGLTIAVDPGHPPIGSNGPTGLYEAVAALAVSRRVHDMLQERGATVVMTRTSDAPVELGARPIIARHANADVFVSVHLNAFPDGINPFVNNGTGDYYFQPQSEPLARALQNSLVANLGLRNIGVHFDNLAVVRTTWMPAVLCEGAFMMIPEQENALRTPEFQTAYARAVVEGLETYFRALALQR